MYKRQLIDRIAGDDMVRGVTIAAGGFFGPQGRELRVPLADPYQTECMSYVVCFLYDTNDQQLVQQQSGPMQPCLYPVSYTHLYSL